MTVLKSTTEPKQSIKNIQDEAMPSKCLRSTFQTKLYSSVCWCMFSPFYLFLLQVCAIDKFTLCRRLCYKVLVVFLEQPAACFVVLLNDILRCRQYCKNNNEIWHFFYCVSGAERCVQGSPYEIPAVCGPDIIELNGCFFFVCSDTASDRCGGLHSMTTHNAVN